MFNRIVLSILLAALPISGLCAAARVDLLLRDVTVIDVVEGRRLPHRDIAVRDGRIVAIDVHDGTPAFEADRSIDGSGKFAIPGLWDMHVHFGGGEALIEENSQLPPLYVAHGITAVRDAAGDLSPSVFRWRDEVATGKRLGPTLFTSGPKIEGIDSIWPGDLEVGTEAELDAALDKLQAWKVDFVKITTNTLTPELFLQTLAKAGARGMKTSAHIPMAVSVVEASDAGLDSIEHIGYAYRAGAPDERALSAKVRAGELTTAQASELAEAGFDPQAARKAYRHLAANGTAVTPTLNGSRVVAYLDQDDHRDDDYLKYIGPGLQATYTWRVERAAKDDAEAIARRHQRFERHAAILPLLQEAGVMLLAGTDAGFLNSYNYPGIGLHQELALFVRYGLTPLQALQAATIHGARFLGHEDTHGSLAAGKVADIVLLRDDPLRDIAATTSIDTVVLRGKAYNRNALDAMLEDVRWDKTQANPNADAGVGIAAITIADPIGGGAMPGFVFYPSTQPTPGTTAIGPYNVAAAFGVPEQAGAKPLVVISHGHGGSRLGHRDLATYLAGHGFIVATLEHPKDNFRDKSGDGHPEVMYGRPIQVAATISALLADPRWKSLIDPDRIGVAGFSAGGYTSLMVVGAVPRFDRFIGYCERHAEDAAICGTVQRLGVGNARQALAALQNDLKRWGNTADPRVKAAFAMAPQAIPFDKVGLAAIDRPVFLYYGQNDQVLLPSENAQRIAPMIRTLAAIRMVPKADHWVFLAPCSAELAKEIGDICRDPPGVDRAEVHRQVNADALAFFRKALGNP